MIAGAASAALLADANAFADPPSRVARVSFVSGQVSFRAASIDAWDSVSLNYPLTIGDHLWSDRNGRVELEADDLVVRVGALAEVGVLNLDDRTIQLRLSQGTANVRVRDLAPGNVVEIDTPNAAVSLLQPGTYRIDVNEGGDASAVTVRRGDVDVLAGRASYRVHAQESMEITGFDMPRTRLRDAVAIDAFEDWCLARDRHADTSSAAKYVPSEVIGSGDLDEYGAWSTVAEYGAVWTPRVGPGWAPYRDGRWVWVDPWGWTWVDAAPWGFAPFHYGRWAYVRGGWAWVPGRFVARPVYAPALVAFVGSPGWGASLSLGSEPVGWFPLGPREAYAPAYRVSAAYVRGINQPQVTGVTGVAIASASYVNRGVPGAVTAVPRDAFGRARSLADLAVAVPREAASAAVVVGHAAPVAEPPRSSPERATGANRIAAPPAAVVNRTVTVRRQPPPTSAASITGRSNPQTATPPPPPPALQKQQPRPQSQSSQPGQSAPPPQPPVPESRGRGQDQKGNGRGREAQPPPEGRRGERREAPPARGQGDQSQPPASQPPKDQSDGWRTKSSDHPHWRRLP